MRQPPLHIRIAIACAIVAVAVFASHATAQTQGQFAQLVNYSGQVAARLLVAEQTIKTQRAEIDSLYAYLRDFTCKHNKLVATASEIAKATDSVPVTVTITTGKDCSGNNPAPQLPPEPAK